MSNQSRKRIEVVEHFLTKIGKLDFEGAAQHLADTVSMEMPYVEGLEAAQGKSTIVNQLSSTIPHMVQRMDFTFDEWYPVSDADVVIAEYHSRCPRVGNAGVYENQYIGVFRFEGDKIILYKEYLNPLKLDFGG